MLKPENKVRRLRDDSDISDISDISSEKQERVDKSSGGQETDETSGGGQIGAGVYNTSGVPCMTGGKQEQVESSDRGQKVVRTQPATTGKISKPGNISKLGNKVRREGNSSDISEINILNVLKPIGPITYKQYIEEGPRTFTELLMRKREVRWSPGKGEKKKVNRVENRERKENGLGTPRNKSIIGRRESQEMTPGRKR